MDYFSLLVGFVVGSLVAFVIMYVSLSRIKGEMQSVSRESETMEKLGTGLSQYTDRLQQHKEEAKNTITAALVEKGSMKNKAIAALLGVSSATVTRYMDELEQDGKVVQHGGSVGRGVSYTLKNGSDAV